MIIERNLWDHSANYSYRGTPMQKNPLDLANYLEILWRLAPRTIIEVGSFAGGSALWFADQLKGFGIKGRVISLDLKPPQMVHPDIDFIKYDQTFELPSGLSRPILCIEDSSHTYAQTLKSVKFFANIYADYIVVEDLHVRAVRRALKAWPTDVYERKPFRYTDNAWFERTR